MITFPTFSLFISTVRTWTGCTVTECALKGTPARNPLFIKGWKWGCGFGFSLQYWEEPFWALAVLLSLKMVKPHFASSLNLCFSWKLRFWLSLLFALFFSSGVTLLEIKSRLNDSRNFLGNWRDSDEFPCKWTGVSCYHHDHRVRSM